MEFQKIYEASEAVSWLAEQAGTPGEHAAERTQMAFSLQVAALYMVEYAAHVSRGLEPYDALMATVKGEMELSPSQRDMLRVLMPPATPGATS